MPTDHPRIQVTVDRELAAALVAGAPHLSPGLSRSRQVRDLAIAGAHHLSGQRLDERTRQDLLEILARSFDERDDGALDRDLLRDGKRRAWPTG